MRRRLVLVVLATTGLVVVAFALPLGALVRSIARDRAVAAADRDAASLAPVLSGDPSTEQVETTVENTGSALAEDDGRAWAVEVGGGTGPVPVAMSADEAAAVDALVGNVFAHTPEGTPYTLWVGAAAGVAHLVVEDACPGIEAPDAVVGRGATRAGSTGLGLDIVRQAAEAAGGRIEVGRSALGGARVALVVPLAAARER